MATERGLPISCYLGAYCGERLILESELFAENKNLLGAQQFKIDIGFSASLDTIAANHQYLAYIVLTAEYPDLADGVGLDIDEEVEIFLGKVRMFLGNNLSNSLASLYKFTVGAAPNLTATACVGGRFLYQNHVVGDGEQFAPEVDIAFALLPHNPQHPLSAKLGKVFSDLLTVLTLNEAFSSIRTLGGSQFLLDGEMVVSVVGELACKVKVFRTAPPYPVDLKRIAGGHVAKVEFDALNNIVNVLERPHVLNSWVVHLLLVEDNRNRKFWI